MTERYNLVFAGNQSVDKKVCIDGKYVEVIGGSAYNSFCASKIFYNNLNSAYFAPVGNETKKTIMNQFNLNQKVENVVVFIINEISGECDICLVPCKNNSHWQCDHLHISLRCDVDVESFLDGRVGYKTLSVDVTHASVEKFKPIIETIKNKIDFLFCNTQEYQHINKINIKGSFVVTNEGKPVRVQSAISTKYFATPTLSRPIKSVTGAGDSFIGAFLSEQASQNNIEKSVAAGIAAGQVCLDVYGNEKLDKGYFKRLFERYKNYTLNLPNRVFVIGPSCAGKTTLINNNPNLFDIYARFDDLQVLKERVNYDNGEISPEQLMKYHSHDEKLSRATIKHDDTAFKIIDDGLWTDVIRRLGKKLVNFSLIEFSRGSKQQYVDAIKLVMSRENSDENLVVFIDAKFDIRLKRNFKRRDDGGHFVELETFETFYHDSCSELFEKDLLINNKTISVINIVNENYYSTLGIEKQLFTRAVSKNNG